MQVVRFGLILVAALVVISGNAFAQESDYNDALKAQLKQEDTPTTPPKKVVHKKILKASSSQSAKVAAQKKAMAKNVKVAQTESSVSHINVEAVQAKNVQPAKDEDELAAPVLGESAVPQPAASQTLPTYQPIFILQPTQAQIAAAQPAQGVAAPSVAGAAQVQPTTTVDSTSVPEPRSEQLRRQREDLEHQTESKLIEKLEDDRLSSEKDRANKIFNPQPSPAPTPVTPAAVVPVIAPVAAVTPAPAPVVAPVNAVDAVVVGEPSSKEVVAAPAQVVPVAVPAAQDKKDSTEAAPALSGETKASADPNAVKEEEPKRFSIGALGGLPSYPSVGNVTSYYAVGAMGAYKFADHLALQSQFEYSKYDIKNAYFCPFCFGGTLVKGLDQYDISLGLDFTPITFGSVTPVAGVLVDFARRNYYDRIDYGYTYGTPTGSNAFNAGLMLGLDLSISKNLVLGAQFSYLWNISYWTDDPLAYGLYGPIYGTPIESLSYYLASLNLRFAF